MKRKIIFSSTRRDNKRKIENIQATQLNSVHPASTKGKYATPEILLSRLSWRRIHTGTQY